MPARRAGPSLESFPDLGTPADVMLYLGRGKNAVYGALKRGEIPSVRVGARYVISRRRFLAWLEGEQ
jgi:excisionase family DNA binding protein